ncbi:hypothetical protein SH139x_002366 [Planctomycetaceae bacterium SH139]
MIDPTNTEMPAPEMPAPEMPAPEMPAPEMPAPETVSSSPPRPLPRSALVVCQGRATGPIQLPLDDPLAFIADFNARYQAAGLRIISPQL